VGDVIVISAFNDGDRLTGRPAALRMRAKNKKAVLSQGNRAMPQLFFSV